MASLVTGNQRLLSVNILKNCHSIIHYGVFFCILFTDLYDTAPEHVCVYGHARSFLIVGTGFLSKTIGH